MRRFRKFTEFPFLDAEKKIEFESEKGFLFCDFFIIIGEFNTSTKISKNSDTSLSLHRLARPESPPLTVFYFFQKEAINECKVLVSISSKSEKAKFLSR